MSWYNEGIFYHIYPLGLTGAPKENDYGTAVHRLNTLLPWIDHIKEIGCTALYIGPLFESVGHGYETTDYKKLDSRLGTNKKSLTNFVKACHEKGIRVIFDGVFNHTGRDFFAFKDIQKNREHSPIMLLTTVPDLSAIVHRSVLLPASPCIPWLSLLFHHMHRYHLHRSLPDHAPVP